MISCDFLFLLYYKERGANFSGTQNKIGIPRQRRGDLIGKDGVFFQIGYLNHSNDAIFGVIQKEIGLGRIFQGKNLDGLFIDIVVGNTGLDAESTGT